MYTDEQSNTVVNDLQMNTDKNSFEMSNMQPTHLNDLQPTTTKAIIKRWPKSTFCIIGTEFCERFSFYGMRAVLTLYAINILRFNSADVVYLYHGSIVLCYVTPILGSILADGYIGKFWTIFSISIVYAAGQLLLALSSAFASSASVHPWLDIFGLVLISIGTGGIKPCVAAFGGDQFNPQHVKMISIFFSVFYFSINAGSTVSMFITPELRAIPCRGQESCFPMAFGVPAVLMLIATGLFMAGSASYKKMPPKENVIFRVASVISSAIKNKAKSKIKRNHWLEHYLDTHRCETDDSCLVRSRNGMYTGEQCSQKIFVGYVINLFRVIIMLLPVPVFWSLYDQQGSKWTIQALAMDGRITNSFKMLPDQMGILNAFLILVFIPIFQFLVYPSVEKLGIKTTALRRMAAGGFLASLAFIICAIVQLQVNETLPESPPQNMAFVSFVNTYPNCNAIVQHSNFSKKIIGPNKSLVDDVVHDHLELFRIDVDYEGPSQFYISFYEENCTASPFTAALHLKGGKVYTAVISPVGFLYEEALSKKPEKGQGESNININLMIPCSEISEETARNGCTSRSPSKAYSGDLALCRIREDGKSFCDPENDWDFILWPANMTRNKEAVMDGHLPFTASIYDYKDIRSGRYHVYYSNTNIENDSLAMLNRSDNKKLEDVIVEIQGMGGVYSLTLTTSKQNNNSVSSKILATMHTIVFKNHINILWQTPQYIVITCAEVLISMTGIEFAYSQAAPVLKSVVQAIWLFTVAVGDIIIIIIELFHLFDNLAIEMVVYAGVMFVVIIIFSLMAIFYYEYAHYEHENINDDKRSVEKSDGTEKLSRKSMLDHVDRTDNC